MIRSWIRRFVLGLVVSTAAINGTSCKGPESYAHLRMHVSLAHLTPEQRALVRKLTFKSQPEGNEDPTRIYQYSVAHTATDPTLDYVDEYLPSPQTGSFQAQVELIGAQNLRLGLKTKTVALEKGSISVVDFDFTIVESSASDVRIQSDPVELTTGIDGGNSFAFIWDTDHYLAILNDLSHGNGDLVSMKLDPLGQPISAPISINSSPRISTLPSIVKLGHGYVVAWQEGNSLDPDPVAVQLIALNKDGVPTGNARQIPTTGIEARPIVEAAFGTVALTWSDNYGTTDAPQRVALVGLLDPSDLSFTAESPIDLGQLSGLGVGDDAFPAIATIGQELHASWVHDTGSVYSAALSDKLTANTTTMLYTSEFTAQQLAVTAAGGELFTAWEDLSGNVDVGRERVRGAYLSADGSLGAGGIIHKANTGSANWPRMAWGTEGSAAIVYYQYRDFGSQIYLTRYTPVGVSVGDTDLQLTNVAGEAKYPDIRLGFSDSEGDHYAVGWIDDHTGVQRVYFEPIVCP